MAKFFLPFPTLCVSLTLTSLSQQLALSFDVSSVATRQSKDWLLSARARGEASKRCFEQRDNVSSVSCCNNYKLQITECRTAHRHKFVPTKL
uniref:Putative secreted protein n=1 Tax=Amblyomma triste TaxID=251400 RepID=A0A023G1K5_AMBTT